MISTLNEKYNSENKTKNSFNAFNSLIDEFRIENVVHL